jgi:DNA-binding NarL/FixJ family response regulator
MRKKVLLVDDHPAMLWALKNMLSDSVHFDIIGEATNGEECIEFSRNEKADLIILDIDMPQTDGLEVIKRLKIISPKSRVLVVSSLDPQIYGGRIRTIGGHGFINKTANSDIIMAACIAVSQGYTFFHTNQSGQELSSDEEIISSFSPREFQVLKYLADGYSNCDISEFLHISNKTVSTYKNRIYRKLGVNNIAELIAFCRNNKVVDI